ncbi:MAG: hypothetical protein ABH805_01725 [Candidatus Nealsonbacteria bacterium]
MKKYSSKQAKKGKLAFRTPSRFFSQRYQQIAKWQNKLKRENKKG